MSPQILQTTQLLEKETVTFEPWAGTDGQGMPSYGSALTCLGNVVEYDIAGGRKDRYVLRADGSHIETPLTIYIEGDETNVPPKRARIALAGDDRRWVVVDVTSPRGLRYARTAVDHYRLRCALEGDE